MEHAENDVHKTPHKNKTHWRNQLKISVLVNLKPSIELDMERYVLQLSNAPLNMNFKYESVKS